LTQPPSTLSSSRLTPTTFRAGLDDRLLLIIYEHDMAKGEVCSLLGYKYKQNTSTLARENHWQELETAFIPEINILDGSNYASRGVA